MYFVVHSLWASTVTDAAAFWAMVAAIAAVILTIVAYWQLRSLAATSRSDFVYRLKKDFFTEETRRLIFLAENELLEFDTGEPIAHFRIVGHEDRTVKERLRDLGIDKFTISTYEVDDALLGPMEDMGVLESMGLISLKEVYEAFVTYINICVENSALRAYLEYSRRDPDDDDVYDHLWTIYNKLKERTPKIRSAKRFPGAFRWPR